VLSWFLSSLGNPQQNATIERYQLHVRYDWLAQYLNSTPLSEVQELRDTLVWTLQ